MSYCRFTEGDVYAYACDGGVQFYVSDGKRELDRLCNTANEAYQYAKVLRDTHGLDVPNYAIEALKADAIEEAVRICGPNSAVSDLEAENAELVRVLHELEQEAVHAYRCLQHDCEQVLESEQHFFKKWWSSDCENAKLRELVLRAEKLMQGVLDNSSDTVVVSGLPCCDTLYDNLVIYREDMRDLGIEVGE